MITCTFGMLFTYHPFKHTLEYFIMMDISSNIITLFHDLSCSQSGQGCEHVLRGEGLRKHEGNGDGRRDPDTHRGRPIRGS